MVTTVGMTSPIVVWSRLVRAKLSLRRVVRQKLVHVLLGCAVYVIEVDVREHLTAWSTSCRYFSVLEILCPTNTILDTLADGFVIWMWVPRGIVLVVRLMWSWRRLLIPRMAFLAFMLPLVMAPLGTVGFGNETGPGGSWSLAILASQEAGCQSGNKVPQMTAVGTGLWLLSGFLGFFWLAVWKYEQIHSFRRSSRSFVVLFLSRISGELSLVTTDIR